MLVAQGENQNLRIISAVFSLEQQAVIEEMEALRAAMADKIVERNELRHQNEENHE